MDGSMDPFIKWETETYPRLWGLAYDAGEKAREEDLPRECNLETSDHCHNGRVLKVYLSAWKQGYDGHKIPAVFGWMESFLAQLPTKPIKEEETMTTVKIECGACKATGLYVGFAEPPETAVICRSCEGKGYKEAKEFTSRQPKPGIKRVMADSGLWMLRGTPTARSTISIQEFYKLVPDE